MGVVTTGRLRSLGETDVPGLGSKTIMLEPGWEINNRIQSRNTEWVKGHTEWMIRGHTEG